MMARRRAPTSIMRSSCWGAQTVAVVLLCLALCIHSAPLDTDDAPEVSVPYDARPGHVVAVLRSGAGSGVGSKVTEPQALAGHFTVLSGGVLVTSQKLSSAPSELLAPGHRVTLVVRHGDSDSDTRIQVHVDAGGSAAVRFESQPYSGSVPENRAPGTEVAGLEPVRGAVEKFPYGCVLRTDGGAEADHFELSHNPATGNLRIVTKSVFDRESRATYFLLLSVECPGKKSASAYIKIDIEDENDNAPVFEHAEYFVTLAELPKPTDTIATVAATDSDYGNQIMYSFQPNTPNADLFRITPKLGTITAPYPDTLRPITYALSVLATDQDGRQSAPSLVHIQSPTSDSTSNHIHINNVALESLLLRRLRREVRDVRYFVIERTWEEELFTIADPDHPDPDERYAMAEDGLSIDAASGMVSLETGHSWDENVTTVEFVVNVTRTDDADFLDFQPVMMTIVTREYTALLLDNPFVPLAATVPTWIRPYTAIAHLEALDADDCPVRFQLQSGGDGRFMVDAETGEVQVAGRAPFQPEGEEFTLAVSTMCQGSALRTETPAQTLTVQVGTRPPQFLIEPYDIWYSEYAEADTQIATIRAKSFQELPLSFSWSMTDPDAARTDLVRIDSDTGAITLLRKQMYVDPASIHRLRLNVTATEEFSGFTTTAIVELKLQPENAHAPVLPPAMFVEREISEVVDTDFTIMDIDVSDVDWLENGTITFTTSDEHFIVENPDGKEGQLKPAMRLDYDYLRGRYYEFEITATDNAPEGERRSTSTSARVFMTNVNDEAPVLDPPDQIFRLKEGAQVGLVVHVVQAYDPDGDEIKFEFEDCNSATRCDIFDINADTGAITLNDNVPTESPDVELKIVVTDDSSCCPGAPGNQIHESRGTVTVEFIGVNHPPQFPDCASYMDTELKEGEPVGTSILNITARDTDSGSNGELTYSIVVDNQGQYFQVREVEGMEGAELISRVVFDRETPATGGLNVAGDLKYKVTVTATDNGRPSLSTNCFFFVTITDVNDMAPLFDDFNNIGAVPNDLVNGDRVIRVFAVDLDKPNTPNSEVRYEIESEADNCPDCFDIVQDSGWIRMNTASLPDDVDQVKMVIRATDGGTPQQTATVDTTITILSPDSTDLPPKWDLYNGQELDDIDDLRIDENSQLGTTLVELTAQLPNGNDPMVYYVINGNTPQTNSRRNFRRQSLPSEDLRVVVGEPINYEAINEYWIPIRASNEISKFYTTVRLNVKLNDLNDNSPTFEGLNPNGQYPAAVTEETQSGDFVFTVVAIDLDGTSPNNEVSYSFPAQCGEDCDAFTITEVDQRGEIDAAQSFDRSVQSTYRLVVQAQDGAPGINPPDPNTEVVSSVVIVIGSSEFPPKFEAGGETLDVEEAMPINSTVAVIEANDPDPEFNFAQYEIVGGNEARRFACDIDSGRIYNTGFLVYDEQAEYHLRYRVFDGFEESLYWVNISLVDTNYLPPVFSPLEYTSFEYTEHEPVDDGFVVQVTATDPDQNRGGDIRYDLAGALYTSQRFQVDVDGNVYVKEMLDRDYPFGYDTWQINAAADDEFELPGSSPLRGFGIINYQLKDINDNAPFFDESTMVGYVPENSGSGTTVVRVEAYDYDDGANGTVSYAPLIVPVDDDGDELFEISAAGVVTTLITNSLDREDTDLYYMKIRASDGGNPSKSTDGWLAIHVTDENDHAPQFPAPSYVLSIPENQPRGTSVLALTAADADIGDNAKLYYQITDGNTDDKFYMDSIFVAGTGVIKINKVLDVDNSSPDDEFDLVIRVNDPDNSDTINIRFVVTDVNDNAPEFVPSEIGASLPEDAAVGTSVATFTATDIDSDENGQFTYVIDYANTDPLLQYAVDPDSGLVTVRNNLDRETEEVMTVHILAIDEGEPAMTGTGTLTVTVQDVNDNAPRLAEDYVGFVYASTRAGDAVLLLEAVDDDAPENGPPITFTLDCNQPECNDFSIQRQSDSSAVIRAELNGYNRLTLGRSFYDLPITLTDSGSPAMSATYIVRVVIESNNDHDHRPGNKRVRVYNYRGEYDNIAVGRVYCEDEDDWDLPDKTFEFYGTAPEGFSVDADTGDVTMRKWAGQGEHKLEFLVKDGVRNVEAVCTMTIYASYVTDNELENAASFRIEGMTAEDFITENDAGDSPYELFVRWLVSVLGNHEIDNDVFSINDVENVTGPHVDIVFSAHGSPTYPAARLNGLVMANRKELSDTLGATILEVPVNPCARLQCWDSGCARYLDVLSTPLLVQTNATAMVGVDATYRARCECGDTPSEADVGTDVCTETTCLNDGECVQTWSGVSCLCPDGFDGPRCQQTRHSFDGSGWAWYRSLTSCAAGKLSLEFATTAENGLLLFAGPLEEPEGGEEPDFFVLELSEGYPRIRVNLGDGEVSLRLDGALGASTLNDGNWHSIEYFYDKQDLRMVVDHCEAQVIDENINTTAADRSMCEAAATSPGDYFLLNVDSPLQMGGRSHDVSYPSINVGGFDGCVRNLMQNGILYDLHIGTTGEASATGSEDGCARDGCDLDPATLAPPCAGNATCVGVDVTGSAPRCECKPGWMGDDCDMETTSKTFTTEESFIEWELQNWNESAAFDLQVMFRTRRDSGIIWAARSFSTLERAILRVESTHLEFVYDLGDDDRVVALPYVNVSDGAWHVARVRRHANQVILQLDGGEGKYYAESYPDNRFRLVAISPDDVFGAAIVSFNSYSGDATVYDALADSCLSDVRLDRELFPLEAAEIGGSAVADVVRAVGVEDQCLSTACDGVTCPADMMCVDRWKMPFCMCVAPDETELGDICVLVTDCSIPRCVNGFCLDVEDGWRCDCDEGWEGDVCDTEPGVAAITAATFSNGAIAAIVVCLIGLLLILLLAFFVVQRKKPEYLLGVEPDEDVRDNVIYYDEEGAGEEDMHAYDLSRLQKPVGPGGPGGELGPVEAPMVMGSAPPPMHEPRREWDEMPRMAPEPMSDPRRPRWQPGDAPPDIGDFVGDRLHDADHDPNAPPYDSVREYEYEGAGSDAGTLSSLNSGSSGSSDLDFDYLNDLGPRFRKLADMYGDDEGGEDGESSV